ncbi:MAG TPA: TIGR03118 family protein [Candidatus Angelobacter sp.]
MSTIPTRSLKRFIAVTVLMFSSLTFAQHYTQTNLVSNTGSAPVNDPNLQNAWGLVSGPGTPFWVSNNAGGTSTLYSVDATGTAATIVPLVVTIPNAPSQNAPGSPTGVMFNGSPTDFLLAPGKPAIFMFASEDGTIQGWNPGVALNNSVIKVDNSQVPNAKNGAVYKGATIAEIDGKHFILAANFRSGRIDIFDTNFKQVRFDDDDAFNDERIPRDFAPFNVQGVGPNIYVTFAEQDAARHDPVGGAGLGFVDVFDSHGRLLQRLQHGSWMNAPWGVVWATQHFGEFTNTILIGQFRGGNVSAFNPVTGRFLGNMLNPDGSILTIDGLWALRFGNDAAAGPGTTLFFTAGPNGEVNGLFGTLKAVAAERGEDDEQ